MSVALRRPLRLPVLGYGQPDQGFATARVTSPYAWRSDGFHAALDIGNGRQGDVVVAPAAGDVVVAGYPTFPWSTPDSRFGSGNTGGRMVVVRHSPGVYTVNAHLHATAAIPRQGARVAAGDVVGAIGDTGAARIGGAHLHYAVVVATPAQLADLVARRRTVPRELTLDPWPTFAGQLVDDPLEDSDMPTFPAASFDHALADRFTARAGARFRSAPRLTAGIFAELPAGTAIVAHAVVAGDVANGSPTWLAAWLYVDGAYRLGFLHRSTVDDVAEPDPSAKLRDQLRAPLAAAAADVAQAGERIRTARQAVG